MVDEWPEPSAEAAAMIVAGVLQVVDPPQAWIDEFNDAALRGVRLDEIADDPVLVEALRRTNEGNLAQWAQHNLAAPGARVPIRVVEDGAEMVREMVRRGLDSGMLDAFRTAQSVAWRRWMEICFSLTDDVEVLREVLDVTSRSIDAFIDDTVGALADQIAVARAQLAGDTHAERRAAVALVLEGAPIDDARAEAQLHYRLSGPQTAVVLSGAGMSMNRLESVCDSIMAANRLGRRLTVLAGADRLWVWFPADDLEVDEESIPSGIRIAIGLSGRGREAFRRSHFQALGADQTLVRLGSARRVVRYEDLALIGAIVDDRRVVDDFVQQTLGDLTGADPELRECMRIWFGQLCNSTATAARLYTHRNTVVRRLARAEELLPVELSRNAITVAAALEVQHWLE
ncbi:putative CdaR family transcriptional regulator [Gordonia araii NBRC 100433]|uniref:Putative CdaR family transcriptional regulator n=1 Tax=Gordonia araii NBRC 100433 TaxID=1073574 RepID=G7H6K3_9ACTN|nr:helix-turn-helix domain-containing protein [Gordonia araii]NNG98929.1 PucR family transcriptional regulator [Gordonia araii NBRC 100433]GAB11478.1 putative CdaR family transcriptional regulator [Gordonia araii NBRC 100433]